MAGCLEMSGSKFFSFFFIKLKMSFPFNLIFVLYQFQIQHNIRSFTQKFQVLFPTFRKPLTVGLLVCSTPEPHDGLVSIFYSHDVRPRIALLSFSLLGKYK